MATVKTLYSILGVEPTAPAQDVDAALQQAKMRYPQDKLEADDNLRIQFQAIQQAHATLSNRESRNLYDRKLSRAGVQVSQLSAGAEDASSWVSTRNIVVAGVILLFIAGMWFYQSQQRTKAGKEIAERALKLVEEERRQKAQLEQQAEERRQIQFDDSQRRRAEADQRQLRNESQRLGQQVQADMRRAEQEAAAEKRRAQAEQVQAERTRQLQERQAQADAARRVTDEKRQLREICLQRYRRPDC